jgi:hypothetical protein
MLENNENNTIIQPYKTKSKMVTPAKKQDEKKLYQYKPNVPNRNKKPK